MKCDKRDTSSTHFLLPRSCHRKILVFPVCVIIIGEDSFVITSQQFGIDCCLQCSFQGLVPRFFPAVFQMKKTDAAERWLALACAKLLGFSPHRCHHSYFCTSKAMSAYVVVLEGDQKVQGVRSCSRTSVLAKRCPQHLWQLYYTSSLRPHTLVA